MSTHPLQIYREQNDLSQEDLAGKLGVSRQLIGLIEAGKRSVTPENAKEWELLIPVSKEALCPDIFGPPVKPEKRKAAA